MASTKITNKGTAPFTLPGGLGGATLAPSSSAIVPYSPQTVGADMATAGITTYSMTSVSGTGSDFDIYLDSALGNDANSGLTSNLPVKTWDMAMSLLPTSYTKACRLHDVTSGGGSFLPSETIYASPRMLGPDASPPTFIGQEADQLGNVVSDVSSTQSSYVGLVVTVSHALRGYSIRNLATGSQAAISDNSYNSGTGKTTFTLANGQALPLNAAGTDQFVVTKQATNILFPQYGLGAFIGPAVFAFQNVRFAAVAEAGFSFPMIGCNDGMTINFFNCSMDGGTSGRTFFAGVNCVFAGAEQSLGWANDSTSTTSTTQAGLWYHTTSTEAVCGAFYNGHMVGYFMLDNCLLYAQGRASLVFMIIDTTNTSLNIYEKSHLELDQALMVGSSPLQNDTILIQEDSFATIANSTDDAGDGPPSPATVTINNSDGYAINVDNSRAHIFDVAGTGNAGAGIRSFMSQVLLDTTYTPTVTGTLGNTLIGASTVVAYGSLPHADAATLSTIQKGT
jgi:hypothetical protein